MLHKLVKQLAHGNYSHCLSVTIFLECLIQPACNVNPTCTAFWNRTQHLLVILTLCVCIVLFIWGSQSVLHIWCKLYKHHISVTSLPWIGKWRNTRYWGALYKMKQVEPICFCPQLTDIQHSSCLWTIEGEITLNLFAKFHCFCSPPAPNSWGHPTFGRVQSYLAI